MTITLRKRTLADGRRSYYLDIHDKGKRWHEALGLYHIPNAGREVNQSIKVKAEERRMQRYKELEESSRDSHSRHLSRSFVDYYEELCQRDWRYGGRERTLKPATLATWKTLTKWLLLWELESDKEYTFRDINAQWVKDFKMFMLQQVADKTLKQSTASLHYTKLTSALQEAVHEGLLPMSPAHGIAPIPMPAKFHTEYLDEAEIQKVAATPTSRPEIKKAFLFAVLCGLRPSDIRELRWKDIRVIDGQYAVMFAAIKTESNIDEMPHYIPEMAVQLVGGLQDSDALIFNLPGDVALNKHVSQLCHNAGISRRITFKAARHSYGTMIMRNTGNIKITAEMMRHRVIANTERYIHVTLNDKRAAANSLTTLSMKISGSQEEGG